MAVAARLDGLAAAEHTGLEGNLQLHAQVARGARAFAQGAQGRRRTFDGLIDQFLPGKYEPAAFALRLARKDVTLAVSLGRELGVPMRLANMTLEEMKKLGAKVTKSIPEAMLKLSSDEEGDSPDLLSGGQHTIGEVTSPEEGTP